MSLGKRLRDLRIQNDFTQDDLLTRLYQHGITVNRITLSRWENDRQIPTLAPVSALAAIYNTSLDYLINGYSDSNPSENSISRFTSNIERTVQSMRNMNHSGQGIVADYAESLDASGKYRTDYEVTEYIETYSVARAAAGRGAYNGHYEEPTYHLIRTEQNIKHDAIIDVVGESMTPTIHNGDIAFIVHTFDRVDGQIYAVNLDDETVIKRCYFEANRLILSSDNPDVEDRIIKGSDLETVRIVGRVVGWTTPEV